MSSSTHHPVPAPSPAPRSSPSPIWRAAPPACSPIRWSATAGDTAPDQWLGLCAGSRLLDAQERGWRRGASPPCGAGSKIRRNLVTANAARRPHRWRSQPRASRAFCELTIDAQVYKDCVAIIRSCSAPSRRGSSTWRRSTPRSPPKAGVPRLLASESIEQTAARLYPQARLQMARLGDRPAFFQIKTSAGRVARGTARAIAQLRPMWAARPAPATTRTTPGSSASP